jgi:hypothetical protein
MREVIAKMPVFVAQMADARERVAAECREGVLPPYLPKKKCKVQSAA